MPLINIFKTISKGIFLLSLFISCSFNYSKADSARHLTPNIPKIIMQDLRFIRITEKRLELDIYTKLAYFYSQTYNAKFYEIQLTELDNTGKISTKAKIAYAYLDTVSENTQSRGVNIHSLEEETLIQVQELFWENANKRLSTPPDLWINIEQKKGFSGQGMGFIAWVDKKYFELTQFVWGKYSPSS